ncbi:MAG: cysteine--tRNA ligase [Acidobacteria bacterium]|nr:MAG: cysteine--tRNA ligase [Acidobacteriota bacterium]
MALRLYNTLTARLDEFHPLEGNQVRIYTCGPTVYDYAHIGNFRTFVFQDILRRYLRYRGYEVRQVMNLTDVDDKTIRNAREAGLELREFTAKYIEAFEVDRKLLNLEAPEFLVRATDHIEDMIRLVQVLVEKGYAYRSEGQTGGSIYFRVEKFTDYGKLSKIDLSGIRAGARVDADEYDKANPRDFVLWKAAKEGEPYWDSPFGPGRPGWHLECSVMAMKYLGETFDIHSGGTDLAFPHHENEIAQSEAATGKPFARFWLHAEHLMVNGERMAKSSGNFYTLRDMIERNYKPTAIRYLLSEVPFRKPLNFTFDGLHQAQKSLERLRNFRYRLTMEKFPAGESAGLRARAEAARRAFEDALDDNLNTAEALAAVFNLVTDGNTAMDRGEFRDGDRAAFLDVLERWDRIFAALEDNDHARLLEFGLAKPRPAAVGARDDGEHGDGHQHAVLVESLSDQEIEERIAARKLARDSGKFAESDRIRQDLAKYGVILEDTKAGTRWKRK